MNKNFAQTPAGIAVIVLAVVVVGYAALKTVGTPARPFSKGCDDDIASGYCDSGGTKCNVAVVISDCGADPVTTPSTLHVCKNNTKITWSLTSSGAASGAKFASNGVDFQHPDFVNPVPGNHTFEWMDKHSKVELDIKYKLHFLKSDASFCRDVDPRVSNE